MPFNRISNLKESSFWVSLLQSLAPTDSSDSLFGKDEEELIDETFSTIQSYQNPPDEQSMLPKAKQPLFAPQLYVKYWLPGLLVIPIPENGLILGYLDISYWAVICYVFGSVLYVIDAVLYWKRFNPAYTDDSNSPALYLNTYASAVFVLNSFLCFLDWYLHLTHLQRNYVSEEEQNFLSQQQSSSITTMTPMVFVNRKSNKFEDDEEEQQQQQPDDSLFAKLTFDNAFYYNLANNMGFLVGAFVFLIQGILLQHKELDSFHFMENVTIAFWINFIGGMAYLTSSTLCCIEVSTISIFFLPCISSYSLAF
jgi:hypothetical protein